MSEADLSDHEHKEGDDTLTRLIDPANCDEFMSYLHEKEEHGHAHGHDHDHGHCHSHAPKRTWRMVTMIAMNAAVFVAELVTGYITKSLSLQSDAWHMLSDEASLIVGLVAHKFSKRLPTPVMTFGWARMEVLGGLVNATFLLAVCLMILFDAIERFVDPPTIEEPLLFLIVGSIGLVANIIGMFMFHDHSHSDNMKGIFLHVMGDFFGSIGVIISAFVYYFSDWEYKGYIDPVFSLLIVIILAWGSQGLFRTTAMTVAERCPLSINTEEVTTELLKIHGLVAVHELHIWELSKSIYIAMIHIVVDSKDHNKIVLESVHNLMIGFGVYSSTVQIEFLDDFPEGVDNHASCFYASSFGKAKRAFITPPVYKHVVGCPHVNLPGQDECEDEHDHDHDHHDHDHGHDHGHDHDHHDHDHDHDHKKDKKKDKKKGKDKHNHDHDHDHHDHDHDQHDHDHDHDHEDASDNVVEA